MSIDAARWGKLDRLATGPESSGARVVVLTGMHGVGKTATSRHWGHANTGRFGDGQLYADFGELRHRGGVEVGDVLAGFLRAFGLPDEVIPAGLAERTALFRSSTAGKRVLLLLDDVDHPAQVRPLIPNAAESVVVVTSRNPLRELIYDGAGLVHLAPLDHDSAKAILIGMIGEQRVASEPTPVEELVRVCAGLPVALRICGARLASVEHWPVASLVDELADEAQRLQRLSIGPERSIDIVFTDAYRALSPVGCMNPIIRPRTPALVRQCRGLGRGAPPTSFSLRGRAACNLPPLAMRPLAT